MPRAGSRSSPTPRVTFALFGFALALLVITLFEGSGGWFHWAALVVWAGLTIIFGSRSLRLYASRRRRSSGQ